jgi:hypothetical protein
MRRRAIAEFQMSLTAANAPLDRFARGARDAMTKGQKRGALLFVGKARCVHCHAVAGRLGHACRRDDPAGRALCRQIARAPIATGSRCLDADQVGGVGWPLAHAVLDGALPSTQGATGDDRSVVISGDMGYGEGILVDIQPNRAGASVRHG